MYNEVFYISINFTTTNATRCSLEGIVQHMKNVYFKKIILCMMSFCKKNHLSYLDTIESGAEEDIFQRLQELYIVAYLLSFERLFLFPKIWKYMFLLKSVTQDLPNKLEIQKTDRYPLPLLVSVVIIYSWFVSI